MTAIKSTPVETLRRNEEKWTKPLMDAGWTAIPSIIIEKQAALGLDPLDINIIVHLTTYWWTADNLPHPSVATIAAALQVSVRTVQKRIRALEELGLLTRQERRTTPRGSDTNLYSFEGLIAAAAPFAAEKLEARKRRAAEQADRIARKKPKLSIVKG
jgi:DNA-binding transcriptional ArsR family regulator